VGNWGGPRGNAGNRTSTSDGLQPLPAAVAPAGAARVQRADTDRLRAVRAVSFAGEPTTRKRAARPFEPLRSGGETLGAREGPGDARGRGAPGNERSKGARIARGPPAGFPLAEGKFGRAPQGAQTRTSESVCGFASSERKAYGAAYYKYEYICRYIDVNSLCIYMLCREITLHILECTL
jgi:hypothetical protein